MASNSNFHKVHDKLKQSYKSSKFIMPQEPVSCVPREQNQRADALSKVAHKQSVFEFSPLCFCELAKYTRQHIHIHVETGGSYDSGEGVSDEGNSACLGMGVYISTSSEEGIRIPFLRWAFAIKHQHSQRSFIAEAVFDIYGNFCDKSAPMTLIVFDMRLSTRTE